MLLAQNAFYELVADFTDTGNVEGYLKDNPVDVILLDLHLPDGGVSALLDVLHNNWTDISIVIITGVARTVSLRSAYEDHTRVIISKNDSPEHILKALDAARRRQEYLSPGIEKILTPPSAALTNRQSEILRMLSEGKINKEMAYALGVSLPTISFHLRELREKLGAQTVREILPKAAEQNLL